MEATEAEVQASLDSLKAASLVIETRRRQGGALFAQRRARAPGAVAVGAFLLLRGPQTAGELRINCERLHSFADISAVEGFLDELAARPQARSSCSCRASPGRARTAGPSAERRPQQWRRKPTPMSCSTSGGAQGERRAARERGGSPQVAARARLQELGIGA